MTVARNCGKKTSQILKIGTRLIFFVYFFGRCKSNTHYYEKYLFFMFIVTFSASKCQLQTIPSLDAE
jgi:hypothetical protein